MSDLELKVDTTTFEFDQVHVLFHRACFKYAEQVAIESGEQRVTYDGLLNRVNSIRSLLLAHQLGQGKVIAIYGERSIDVIACTIAAWAIGSTVMLIESSMLEHRRNLMLKAASTSAVVLCGVDAVIDDIPTIDLRSIQESVVAYEYENHEGDHAYIAFTSGSTGLPKAIVGSHNGLSQFLLWQAQEFSIGPARRFAHLTNLSFDVWFRDVFTPLISGATVCIPISHQLGAQFVFDFLRNREITETHLVPSIANLWVNTYWPEIPIKSLKIAFFAGEPLEGIFLKKWKLAFPFCEVVNLYGPTETTLAKHFKRIGSEVADGVQPVGLNIPGSMSYIMSDDNSFCETGKIGEICIATPYRSHGYLTNDGLSLPLVQVITPELLKLELYRTGDLGRRGANNEIEILGRKDDQIKINGVRIDLLEIKSVIASHPMVSEVFVYARQNRYTKSIVGFVACKESTEIDILNFLRNKLPAVMIPSKLYCRNVLPRLPNGKIDRKSLIEYASQVLSASQDSSKIDGQSTADQIEKIWVEILDYPNLLRSQNFFDVGGNSLAIVVLNEMLEKHFKLKISLVQLFQNSTIDSQMQLIESLIHRTSDERKRENLGYEALNQPKNRRRMIAIRAGIKNI